MCSEKKNVATKRVDSIDSEVFKGGQALSLKLSSNQAQHHRLISCSSVREASSPPATFQSFPLCFQEIVHVFLNGRVRSSLLVCARNDFDIRDSQKGCRWVDMMTISAKIYPCPVTALSCPQVHAHRCANICGRWTHYSRRHDQGPSRDQTQQGCGVQRKGDAQ